MKKEYVPYNMCKFTIRRCWYDIIGELPDATVKYSNAATSFTHYPNLAGITDLSAHYRTGEGRTNTR